MRLGKISMAAVVALAVSSTPVLANPASKLSVATASKSVRAGATVDRKSEAAGGGVILAVLAAAAVIAGIVILADGDDKPASP